MLRIDRFAAGVTVESIFAGAIVAGLIYCGWFLSANGYLPPPFFYEPDDTFADWFNTAFWAHDIGSYDAWKTIYPPLSFVILRFLSLPQCYPDRRSYDFSAGLAARDCDWVGLAAIGAFWLINVYLIWRVMRAVDRQTAIPRTICLGLGLPMLFAVERGNLVLIAFTCFILAFGPLLRSAAPRWIAAALAVNLKVYLVAAIAPLLLRGRWRWVECALISVILIYLASYAILGRGSPIEIFLNIKHWATVEPAKIMDVWYGTTYQKLMTVIEQDLFPFTLIIGSRNVDLLQAVLPVLLRLTQLAIMAAAFAAWLRPASAPSYRLVNFGVLMAIVTSEPGGYAMLFTMLLTLMEPWKGGARIWAITMCYLLALPLDIILDVGPPIARDSYLGNTRTFINYYVLLGSYVRPLLIMTIAWALSAATLHKALSALRDERDLLREYLPRRALTPPPKSRAAAPEPAAIEIAE